MRTDKAISNQRCIALLAYVCLFAKLSSISLLRKFICNVLKHKHTKNFIIRKAFYRLIFIILPH